MYQVVGVGNLSIGKEIMSNSKDISSHWQRYACDRVCPINSLSQSSFPVILQ